MNGGSSVGHVDLVAWIGLLLYPVVYSSVCVRVFSHMRLFYVSVHNCHADTITACCFIVRGIKRSSLYFKPTVATQRSDIVIICRLSVCL